MDTNELRRKRAALVQRAGAILTSAESPNRSLTTVESRDFNALLAQSNGLAEEINRHEGREAIPVTDDFSSMESDLNKSQGRVTTPDPLDDPGEQYRTSGGREFRLLRPDESISGGERRRDGPSLGKIVRGLATGRWEGAEGERRTMSGADDVLGGYLLPAPVSSRVIDLARNKAVIFKAGAQTAPMESAELSLARVAGDPTAYWRHENVTVTKSDMSFERVTLRARTLAAIVPCSVELLEDAENAATVIENALAQALALELDRAALRGIGAAAEPMGIRNWPSVNISLLGANGAVLNGYSNFIDAIELIWEQSGSPNAVIYAPRTAADLGNKKDGNGLPLSGPKIWEDLPIKVVSKQIPKNLTVGTANNCSEVYLGDFTRLVVGIRRELTIEVSRQAADSSNSAFTDMQVWLRAFLRADIALEMPEHFAVITGVLPD